MTNQIAESDTSAKSAPVSRRNFGCLTAAAVGGLILGSTLTVRADDKAKEDPANILSDPHICRGINTCKSKGKGKDNACAGQGTCATAQTHGCDAQNACKGQGGCGAHPGENSCKGLGACEVPLTEKTWKKARKTFEAQMTKQKKTFGSAPPPKKA